MPRNDDKDHEYHLARFSGVRGDAFNTWEKSAREFLEAEFLKDDDHSLWDVIQELDQGSAHGPPIPAAGPAQNSAIRRRLCADSSANSPSRRPYRKRKTTSACVR